ncbi:MAG: putative inorganic carbon transporter subunit DabA, partial [Nitrospirales bacterium]
MNKVEQDPSSVKSWKWLREMVDEACQPIGPYWPMKSFAYYNPIRDLEHLPFVRAIEEANQLLGAKGFLPVEEYRQFFHQGRITLSAIDQALRRVGPPLPSRTTMQVSDRRIHVQDVWRIHAVYGIEILPTVLLTWTLELENLNTRFRSDLPEDSRTSIIDRTIRECEKCRHDPESGYLHNLWKSSLVACQLFDPVSGPTSFHAPDLSRSSDLSRKEANSVTVDLPKDRTLGDWLDSETGSALIETINTHMIKWIAAFVDEGVAGWSMPSRDKGFFAAWRELAEGDLSGRFLGIPDLRQKFRELSDAPEEMLCKHLQDLNIPKERWQEYLSRHLAQLPGWAGFIRWRGDHPGYPAQQHYPIDPMQYLAVRLFYESGMVEGLCQREWGIKGTLPALLAYWNEHGKHEQALSLPSSHATDPNDHAVCHQAWRLFHLAQFLELTPIEVHELSYSDISTL